MPANHDMAVFAAVVEHGGFSASAQRLGLTRSAICRRIDRLEARLGVRLVNRTTRKVTTTEAGAAYYERCKELLASIEEAEVAVSEFGGEPIGTLRVNCIVVFGIMEVIPILPAFLQRHPRLSVHLELSDEPLDMSSGAFDVAIRSGDLPDSSFIVTRLAQTHHVVCAAPSYIARHGKPQTPDDLRNHNCLTLSGLGSNSNEWQFETPQGPTKVRVSGNLVVNSGEGHYQALVAGVGIGRALNIRSRQDVAAGRLETMLEDFRPPKPRMISLIHQSRQHVPPKIRSFIEFLRESIQPTTL